MNYTALLDADSTITVGRTECAEYGWDSLPCITLDGYTVFVPDVDTAKRLLDEVARLHASFRVLEGAS